ncbi:fimbria/pilus outer membrane usher protein [Shewanella sp. 10N.286.51.B7]|uniref:fimbria/pilus outer membrane usher protein n=1 Tax=Shewanella sp. 10N.286.51.B7 TaxID=1880836 RepID=UPI000C81E342|nr:fimbria/pilus outer membrane usher protein [Shewanella sp. 10N.286.51.B7]
MFKSSVISILIMLLCLLTTSVMGSEIINPTGRDITLTSLLRLHDTVIGEVEVTITKEQLILMPAEATITLLNATLSDEVLSSLSEQQLDGMISQAMFTKLNIGLSFEMSSLELVLDANSEDLKVGQIDFGDKPTQRSFLTPSLFSGYINLSAGASRLENNTPENDVGVQYSHTLDAGFNYERAVLEYESIYNDYQNQKGLYSRQGTRINYDFPEQGTRLTIGDFYSSGATFQDGGDMLGIGIARDFSLIPTKNVRPTAARQFTLQRASTVDLLVDGVVVRRLTLGAGSYNLQDIPLAEGVSDLELIITDASGKEERISFSIATGMDLLKEGEFEYNFNGGIKSNISDAEPEYEREKYLINGELEYGITPAYTLGGNFQVGDNSYQLGHRSLFATGIGIFDIKTTYSYQDVLGKGLAASVGYDLIGSASTDSTFEFSIYYDYYSQFFIGARNDILVTPEAPINANQHFLSSRINYTFNPFLKVSLTGNYVHAYDDAQRYWTLSPSLSGSIFDTGATWSARVTHKEFLDDSSEFSGLLTLSWPFGSESRVISSYKTDNKEISSEYSYRKNVGNSGGISMFAGATHSETNDIDGDVGIDYDANRFTLRAQHVSRYSDFSEDTNNHVTQAKLATGIAFSGGQLAFGRPVRESFAVIKQHKSIEDNRTEISPSSMGARAYSDGLGPILIPDLAAYSEQVISYEVEDLPAGYDLGAGVFPVYPGNGQGYNLQIGSEAAITLMGTLLDKETQQPITLVAGKAALVGRDDLEPLQFFTNRTGRFAISGVRPGTYKIKLNTPTPRYFELVIDEDSSALLRLGKLYVD